MTLDAEQHRYLRLMDIDVYVPRAGTVPPEPVPAAGTPPPPRSAPPGNPAAVPVRAMSGSAAAAWEALRREVPACTRCGLHRERTQTVFGVGDPQAEWMIIGEAPGAEEDRQGEPFVGRAGQLLNSMLTAIGLGREQVFIANILKCRPPANRDPKPEEAAACAPFLQRQIALVRPRVILALGRIAAQNLLRTDTPIGRMRGHRYEYPDPKVPVVVTYHPAYLLRSPTEKRKAWLDLQMAMKIVRESS
jgi:DNA polymerase